MIWHGALENLYIFMGQNTGMPLCYLRKPLPLLKFKLRWNRNKVKIIRTA